MIEILKEYPLKFEITSCHNRERGACSRLSFSKFTKFGFMVFPTFSTINYDKKPVIPKVSTDTLDTQKMNLNRMILYPM